jgi:hypothetical protein
MKKIRFLMVGVFALAALAAGMGGCGSSNQGSNIALNAGGTGGFG